MSVDDPERKTEIARQFIEAIPHSRDLGMRFLELGDGLAKMTIDYDSRFVGDPSSGVLHGGVITALLDTCMGAAVISHPSSPHQTATIDLRIDYLRSATPKQSVVALAECYKVTRSVAFVRAQAFDENTEEPVATAAGAFTAESGSRRKNT